MKFVLIICHRVLKKFFFYISGGAFGGKETKVLILLPVALAAQR